MSARCESPISLPPQFSRRRAALAAAALLAIGSRLSTAAESVAHPQRRWADAAEAMRRLAVGWGDQPYGAVLVLPDGRVAEGPSRVVKNADVDAHAEREAIREAQRLTGSTDLSGAVLYSTSRPCRLCERAAADARVRRMYHGSDMVDAGAPAR